MEDPIEILALSLVNSLKKSDIKNIKSPVGVLELACDIVEETYQRSKKIYVKLSPEYKKKLAINILKLLGKKLLELKIIDTEIYNGLEMFADEKNIDLTYNLIDDIISIWNDVKTVSLKLCGCFKTKKKVLRKFEHLENESFISTSSV
jgi:hypothetical protein